MLAASPIEGAEEWVIQDYEGFGDIHIEEYAGFDQVSALSSVIAHLEICRITPEGATLPITSTGYRSQFHECGTAEAHGGDVVAQVTAWLNEEATKPEWHAHLARTQQGELF
ncbi:MAG: antirestriction protein ArdA [Sphingorhabdus sp.]